MGGYAPGKEDVACGRCELAAGDTVQGDKVTPRRTPWRIRPPIVGARAERRLTLARRATRPTACSLNEVFNSVVPRYAGHPLFHFSFPYLYSDRREEA